jgi:hypothetical protein
LLLADKLMRHLNTYSNHKRNLIPAAVWPRLQNYAVACCN